MKPKKTPTDKSELKLKALIATITKTEELLARELTNLRVERTKGIISSIRYFYYVEAHYHLLMTRKAFRNMKEELRRAHEAKG